MLKITGEKEFKETYLEQRKAWNNQRDMTAKGIFISIIFMTVAIVLLGIFSRILSDTSWIKVVTMGIIVVCCSMDAVLLLKERQVMPSKPDILKLVKVLKISDNNTRLLFNPNDQSKGFIYFCHINDEGNFKEYHIPCSINHDETSGEDDVTIARPDENGNVELLLANNTMSKRIDWSVIGDMITMTSDEVIKKYC